MIPPSAKEIEMIPIIFMEKRKMKNETSDNMERGEKSFVKSL